MFTPIAEYMLLQQEERQKHLDLSSECVEIGGASRDFRALLAHHLQTFIPTGHAAYLCHACNNGQCSNVKHLYWGTPKENHKDAVKAGTASNPYQKAIEKYGQEGFLQMCRENGLKTEKSKRKQLTKS